MAALIEQQIDEMNSILPDSRCCSYCSTKDTPQWRVGPNGPQTLCNACGVRYGRQIRASGKKRPAKAKSTAAKGSVGQKRKQNSPSYEASGGSDEDEGSRHCIQRLAGQDSASEGRALQQEASEGLETAPSCCLAALDLMILSVNLAALPAPRALKQGSVPLLPDDIMRSLAPSLSAVEATALKERCDALKQATLEADAAEAAVLAVEFVLEQRREVARQAAIAAKAAADKLTRAQRLATEGHGVSPRKGNSPKRSAF